MDEWRKINEANLYYIKYNVLPNIIAFGLAYAFFNHIRLKCSIYQYFNNVISLFNIRNINIYDQFKLVDNILINKYGLMIINFYDLEIIKIKK